MIVNSKFSSLYLGRKESWKAPFDQDVCYVQKYAIGEEIRIQFICYTSKLTAKYINDNGEEVPLDMETLQLESGINGKRLNEIVFSIDTEGAYKLVITNGVDEAYSQFCILPVEELENTVLISYTHRRNEYDTIFINPDGTQKNFNFRIEGGLYPGDKVQAVENEIFRDQRFEPYQTAAESYEISTLTIGTKKGVPGWVGNKINNIFKLSNILVDGIDTTRNESSIPELISQSSYYPLYVFKLKVEQPDEERIDMSDPIDVLGTENRILVITENGNNYILI